MKSPTSYKFRHYGKNPDPTADGDVLLWASNGRDSIFPRTDELIVKGGADDLAIRNDGLWTPNALANEGEEDILDVYFDTQAVRTSLYLRLYTDAALAETDTLATATGEESGSGYGAITCTRGTDWTAPDHSTGTVLSTKTFNATGTWSALNSMILATVGTGTSGLLIAWVDLSATRSLVNGDSLDVDLTVTLE